MRKLAFRGDQRQALVLPAGGREKRQGGSEFHDSGYLTLEQLLLFLSPLAGSKRAGTAGTGGQMFRPSRAADRFAAPGQAGQSEVPHRKMLSWFVVQSHAFYHPAG